MGKYISTASLERADPHNEGNEEIGGSGLMFGITPALLRLMCDDPFMSGGAGYTITEVAKMTPDQVYFRLCERKLLDRFNSGKKTQTKSTLQVAAYADEQGNIKGRSEDGKPLNIPFSVGKSKAQRIREELARKKKEQQNGNGTGSSIRDDAG